MGVVMSEWEGKYRCFDGGLCGVGGHCKDCPLKVIKGLQEQLNTLRNDTIDECIDVAENMRIDEYSSYVLNELIDRLESLKGE